MNGVYGNFTRCYCFFDVLMKIVVVVAKLTNVSATGSEEAVVFEGYFPD